MSSALSVIRRYRDANGLTQGQMGERVGVTAATISRWENAKREPRSEERRRLAEVIGVPVAELLEPVAEAAQ